MRHRMYDTTQVITEHVGAAKFSANRALLIGFGGAAILLVGLLGWSIFSSISGAVIATGRVAVESHNQAVEHIDGGTVSEILARNGDRVAAGETLLRFDDELLRTEEAILAVQFAELAARRNRLEAEFSGADTVTFDSELDLMASGDPRIQRILEGQQRLFIARNEARRGEIERLQEQIGQARNEIAGLEAQTVSLREQSALIGRELEAEQALFERGLSELPMVLELERSAQNLAGQSGATAAQIARARGRISELEIEILLIDSRHIEDAEEQVNNIRAQENEVIERLAAVRERLGRMEVRAPVAGEVFGAAVFAPGEVVIPGEPILQIVPDEASLVVMARVEPSDIDQVYPGQEALLRFSSFPARLTSEFDGFVTRISADTVIDPNLGTTWYDVELSMVEPVASAQEPIAAGNARQVGRRFGDLLLTPGMPVEAHIRTESRTVISFLLKPITDFFSRSMREE